MQVITQKDRDRRWNELNRPEIDSLMKKADKEGKGGRSAFRLAKKFGIEGDYSFTANEHGNFPEGI